MGYPVAYRKGSSQYGSPPGRGAKAFKLPPPYKPPTKAPANDNYPKPANDNLRRARRMARTGLRIARLHPAIGRLMNLYDLYRLLRGYQAEGQNLNPDIGYGFILQQTCLGGLPPTHVYITQLSTLPWPSTACFGFSAGSAAVPLNSPMAANVGRFQTAKIVQDSPARYAAYQYWYRPSTTPSALNRPLFRNLPVARPNPYIDPNLLPILQPMQYPVPVINPLDHRDSALTRVTGPKPHAPFVPRRPPPARTREQKLRATPAVIRVLQRAAHAATEGEDFVDALHSALPKRLQAKGTYHHGRWWPPSPQAKAKAVWDNYREVDWNEAMVNLAVNHATDEVLGRASGAAQNFATRNNVVLGLQL